jgi:tripartite-type tricarboxylate transporter receptor subunit TctC
METPMYRMLATVVAALLLWTGTSDAQTIKMVVPFAAGGPVDQVARILANELRPHLGAEVVVENRSGAGGALGSEAVARAPPDGQTMLLASSGSHVISPTLKPPPGYDAVKSFEPIALVGSVSSLLVVSPKLQVASLAELIAKAKAQKMSYASAGPGTTMNIAGEMLNVAAGLKVTHVPYRGAGPAINDLIGGHVDMLNADVAVLLPMVTSNSVKALALYGKERSPLLQNVPTTVELGFPDIIMENWYGVFLPAGATPEVTRKLERAVLDVLANAAVKERLTASGIGGSLDRAAFKAKLEQDFAYWPGAIKRLGITAE